MDNFRLAATCLLVVLVSIQDATTNSVSMKYDTETAPSFYNTVPVTVTCELTFDVAAAADAQSIGLLLFHQSDSSPDVRYFGCTVTSPPIGKPSVSVSNDDGYAMTSPSQTDCSAYYDDFVADGQVSYTIVFTPNLPGSYKCGGFIDREKFESGTFDISEVKELPTDLTSSVTDKQGVYLDDQVEFSCQSVGGNPASKWKYTEQPTVGEMKESMETPLVFKATKEDNGAVLTCEDLSHVDYKPAKVDSIYYTATLPVYYLEAPVETKQVRINPSHTEELDCATEGNLPPNVNLTYAWAKNGEDLPDTGRIYLLSYDNSTTDTITCEASTNDDKLTDATITFDVMWDDEASTPKPTPPSTSPKEPTPKSKGTKEKMTDNSVTIIIIVVVCLVVIIAVVIIIVFVLKRRQSSGSSDAPAKGDNRTPEKADDPEKGNSDGATEKQPLNPNNSN